MTAAAALAGTARRDGPAVLATLTRQLGGDLALAEDALQDAYLSALAAWEAGVPEVPAAWLTTTARRKALDRLRGARRRDERIARLTALAERDRSTTAPAADADLDMDDPALTDDRLRLLFTCCHPALALPARVALTVASLGGLSCAETAAAFLVSESTMHQRLRRARRKIVDAGIPFRVPPDKLLGERTAGVLATVSVIFTEGHTATSGPALGRPDLADEAVRLGRLIVALLPDDPEAAGLLALMVLTEARRPARTDPRGAAVGLAEQDRTRWDAGRIDEGLAVLDLALARRQPGPYQLQAAIAALHAHAPSFEATDWSQIATLYAALERRTPTPVVTINRAVALGFAHGPRAGLDVLAGVRASRGTDAYVPFHAARADLLRRAGDPVGADAAYDAAITACANATQSADLSARRAAAARKAAVGTQRAPGAE